MRFTLDHNCLIDLEDRRPNAIFITALAESAELGQHTICVPASAGAERLRDGTTPVNFGLLQFRLAQAGLENAEILFPLLRVDFAFVGFSVVSGPELERLEAQIRGILLSRLAGNRADHLDGAPDKQRAAARWANATLDVDAMWCHIHYDCDVFVTNDSNFHKPGKREALVALGAHRIERPSAAAELARAS